MSEIEVVNKTQTITLPALDATLIYDSTNTSNFFGDIYLSRSRIPHL